MTTIVENLQHRLNIKCPECLENIGRLVSCPACHAVIGELEILDERTCGNCEYGPLRDLADIAKTYLDNFDNTSGPSDPCLDCMRAQPYPDNWRKKCQQPDIIEDGLLSGTAGNGSTATPADQWTPADHADDAGKSQHQKDMTPVLDTSRGQQAHVAGMALRSRFATHDSQREEKPADEPVNGDVERCVHGLPKWAFCTICNAHQRETAPQPATDQQKGQP